MNRDAWGDCLITGIGRAICGVESVPGMLIDHKAIMEVLVGHGLKNPLTGSPLTMDWADRNLGSETISIGDLEPATKHLRISIPDDAQSASEWDLMDKACRDAMHEANVEFDEIDCIIHVSPTISAPRTAIRNVGFQDCLREFHERFPLRDDCRLYHFHNGCSGVLPPLFLARGLLASGSCECVLIVTSVWGGGYRDVPHMMPDNDIKLWLSGLLFGDAAAAAVLTSTSDRLENGRGYFEVMRHSQFNCHNEWVATFNPHPEGDYIALNPATAKKLFVDRFCYTLDAMGVTVSEFDRLAIHQPNSWLVSHVNEKFKDDLRAPIVDIARKYGNLVCSSALMNLFECRIETPIPDGGSVFLFALGADAGVTYGGVMLRYFEA